MPKPVKEKAQRALPRVEAGAEAENLDGAQALPELKPETKAFLRDLFGQLSAESAEKEKARQAELNAQARAANERYQANRAAAEGAKDLDAFHQLTPAQQEMALDGYTHEATPSQPPSKFRGAQKELATRMVEWLQARVDPNFDPEQFAFAGPVRWEVSLVKLPSGELAGGQVTAYRQGVSVFDVAEPKSEYPSLKAALAAGAEEDDVNWTARVSLNDRLEQVGGSTEFEWTGH